MTTNKLNDGVGKKIVEALKMQTKVFDEVGVGQDNNEEIASSQAEIPSAQTMDNSYTSGNVNVYGEPQILPAQQNVGTGFQSGSAGYQASPQQFIDSSLQQSIIQNFGMNGVGIQNEPEEFNCPANVAVLRQLIAKLPTGVTRQTGALIIKQTMEALGIPMQSVIQDAQQYRETLNNSIKECQANIVEYRKQIGILEAKSQQYQRQSAIMNDIISLFIRTNIR